MSPLEFPTEAQAADYFRTHGGERGRPYVVVGFGAVAEADQWPPRSALGWNAQGVWVFLNEDGTPNGDWP